MLMNSDNDWTVVSCCRKSDPDRNPKFYKALAQYQARGYMGDLNDSSDQQALNVVDVEDCIASLLPDASYDLIFTHNIQGEYTHHRRHEEVSQAVVNLLTTFKLHTTELWMFAYDDNKGNSYPKAILRADLVIPLTKDLWKKKQMIITEIYGFQKNSWEEKTLPKTESFWCFDLEDGQ